jgi:hypothetical protein
MQKAVHKQKPPAFPNWIMLGMTLSLVAAGGILSFTLRNTADKNISSPAPEKSAADVIREAGKEPAPSLQEPAADTPPAPADNPPGFREGGMVLSEEAEGGWYVNNIVIVQVNQEAEYAAVEQMAADIGGVIAEDGVGFYEYSISVAPRTEKELRALCDYLKANYPMVVSYATYPSSTAVILN